MQYLCFANAASDIAAIGTLGTNAANSFIGLFGAGYQSLFLPIW